MDSRAVLKTFFETGDKPTAAQFADLIDSCFNLVDDSIAISEVTGLAAQLAAKVTAVIGYGLSSNDYTSIEKAKLAALNEHFVGVYASSTALIGAHPTGSDGQYAIVESSGVTAVVWVWDTANTEWVAGGSAGIGTWGSITGTLSSQTDLNSALAAKAPLASPALTGTPTAPTPTAGDNSTKIASTAYADTAVSNNNTRYFYNSSQLSF